MEINIIIIAMGVSTLAPSPGSVGSSACARHHDKTRTRHSSDRDTSSRFSIRYLRYLGHALKITSLAEMIKESTHLNKAVASSKIP